MEDILVYEIYNFYKIHEAKEWVSLIDGLSYVGFNDVKETLGIRFDMRNDTLFIPKSVGKHFLEYHLPRGRRLKLEKVKLKYTGDNLDFFNVKSKPLPHQVDVLKEAKEHLDKSNQVVLNLAAGSGKTYMATNLIHHVGKRTLILVKSNVLGNQWIKSIGTHTDMWNAMFIKGTEKVEQLADNFWYPKKVDVIVTTHSTMNRVVRGMTQKEFFNWTKSTGIGMVIFDECDNDTKSMFNFINTAIVPKYVYLTATLFMSSRNKDVVYQTIMSRLPTIRINAPKEKLRRTAEIVSYKIKYPKEIQYRLMRGGNLDLIEYKNDLFDMKDTDSLYPELEEVIKEHTVPAVKEELSSNKKSQIVIFTPTIAGCKSMHKVLSTYGIEASIFNSDVDPKEKKKALKSRVIVSIISSMGRGLDLTDLALIINFQPFSSLSIFQQLIGRIDRTNSTFSGKYIQYNNKTFLMLQNMARKLDKDMKIRFKDVEYFKM